MTDDGERTPSGDLQRSALALLALNAGKVVSADRLIEELWGDLAPANPLNSVQSLISQLRRLLGSERIVTKPPGYLLDLDPDAIDALRFERLVIARASWTVGAVGRRPARGTALCGAAHR